MSERKCTCGVVTQGDLGWVTGSEKCSIHSEKAIEGLVKKHLKDLIERIQTLEIGQGDLYRRIGQGDNTEND
ncbi:hypothetical protein LCGC14_1733140 [marine sediment metagenome]|uniref:Uncharacterized protein n=1 Tax=marine sediment metagenome TaxID=412755 RepID=A0A0F9H8Q6_9ZZZZ